MRVAEVVVKSTRGVILVGKCEMCRGVTGGRVLLRGTGDYRQVGWRRCVWFEVYKDGIDRDSTSMTDRFWTTLLAHAASVSCEWHVVSPGVSQGRLKWEKVRNA